MFERLQRWWGDRELNWPLLISFTILAYLISILGPMIHCYQTGKKSIAEVVRYRPEKTAEGTTIHRYELAFDGHRVVRPSGRLRQIGDKFPVTYRPGQPESVIKGAKPESVWSIIDQNTNDFMLTVIVGAAVLLFVSGIGQIRQRRSAR